MGGPSVLGQYEIQQTIRRDRFGTVYRALQPSMNRTVAVRVLADDLAANDEYVTRFKEKAQTAGQVHHNNLAPILDVGQVGQKVFCVTTYPDGPTLENVLEKGGPLNEATAVSYMTAVASALVEAHRRDLCHGNISPERIILTGQGDPQLVDLEIVLPAGTDAAPYFASPEQTKTESFDSRADLYMLGATFFRLVTGEYLFDGPTPMAVMIKHNAEEPRPLRQVRSECSEGFEAVLLRLLRKEPEDRYPNADALVEDLKEVQKGRVPGSGNVSALDTRSQRPVGPGPSRQRGITTVQQKNITTLKQDRITTGRRGPVGRPARRGRGMPGGARPGGGRGAAIAAVVGALAVAAGIVYLVIGSSETDQQTQQIQKEIRAHEKKKEYEEALELTRELAGIESHAAASRRRIAWARKHVTKLEVAVGRQKLNDLRKRVDAIDKLNTVSLVEERDKLDELIEQYGHVSGVQEAAEQTRSEIDEKIAAARKAREKKRAKDAEAALASLRDTMKKLIKARRFGDAFAAIHKARAKIGRNAHPELRKEFSQLFAQFSSSVSQAWKTDAGRAHDLVEQGNVSAARDVYQSVIRTYGLKTYTREAQQRLDELASIESTGQKFVARAAPAPPAPLPPEPQPPAPPQPAPAAKPPRPKAKGEIDLGKIGGRGWKVTRGRWSWDEGRLLRLKGPGILTYESKVRDGSVKILGQLLGGAELRILFRSTDPKGGLGGSGYCVRVMPKRIQLQGKGIAALKYFSRVDRHDSAGFYSWIDKPFQGEMPFEITLTGKGKVMEVWRGRQNYMRRKDATFSDGYLHIVIQGDGALIKRIETVVRR